MNTHQLSEQQIQSFKTFGFLAFPGLMADRIQEITSEFEELWVDPKTGIRRPHDGKRHSCIVPFIDQREKLCSLLDDPRILAIAKGLLGDNFNYMGSDGNFYVGDTGWHSDGWHPEQVHLKIAFYLDSVKKDTGCLRVIPGSHLPGDRFSNALEEKLPKNAEAFFGMQARDVPAVPLESEPGDILVFNHNIKHAAFGGSSRRRMFTINLCQRYPEQSLGDLRNYISGFARFWVDRVYGEAMVANANSERKIHLEQVMANEGHLAELTRKAKETMTMPQQG